MRKRFPPRQRQFPHRVDHRIRARDVFVIDGETNEKLGQMSIQDAMNLAKRRGLNLVEISANANPPVCKLLDYGKFRYEEEKRKKDSKKAPSLNKVKELKFHINISEHDYETKLRHAEGFMFKGMKTKILMQMRGREMVHKELGVELMKRIRNDLTHVGLADFEPKLVGRSITMMMTPLPVNKRKRRFTEEEPVGAVDRGDAEFELADPAEEA